MAFFQIISTHDSAGHAACEALWCDFASAALSARHRVELLISRTNSSISQIVNLASSGAIVRTRLSPRRNHGNLERLGYVIWQRSAARWLLPRSIHLQPDLRLLNVGTLIEAAMEPWATLLEHSKAPYAIIVHNNPEIRTYSLALRTRLARILQESAAVCFVSDRLRENAEEQLLIHIPNARTVRNPVNLASRALEPWPEVSDSLRMAVVSRLDSNVKGQIRLLHALANKTWKSRKWELCFFGEGPDKKLIEKAIDFYSVGDKVRFGGFVQNIRTDIWRTHHVLVMPSLLEGMPLALVEAMLCGRPAVCTDVGGASELIRDGENGFIVRSPFAKQLDEGLERMWQEKDRLAEIGRLAHQDAMRFIPINPGEELLNSLLTSLHQR